MLVSRQREPFTRGLDLFFFTPIMMPLRSDTGYMPIQIRGIDVSASLLTGRSLRDSRTCPHCQYVRSKVAGRVFRCPKCGWTYHRDGVGSINIRRKYLGQFPVVGVMAPPTGLRFRPQTRVARSQEREAAPL